MIYLGIDVGTQSTKALALDVDSGEVLALTYAKHQMIEGLGLHHAEQDPATWLLAVDDAVTRCIDKLEARKADVRGIAISAQQHGLVILDEKDEVIRPAKLWCDTSTAIQCEELTKQLGDQKQFIQNYGNPILTGYTAGKLLWVKQHEPENFSKIRSVLLPHDYVNFWLTGKKQMEYGDASGTAFFDVRKREWLGSVLKSIDPNIHEALPELGSSLNVLGELKPELCKKWGLQNSVQITAGSGDNMMGALGTANIKEGCATVSLGTSGTIYASAQKPVIDPQAEIAAFCSAKDDWLPLFCTLNSTLVIKMIADHYKWSAQELESLVSRGEPGAAGIKFLPYVSGERTPNLPKGVGAFHGITMLNFSQENVARAMAEGASVGLGHGLNRLKSLGLDIQSIHITGGGSRSPAWRQLLSDMFGLAIHSFHCVEAAALGAAVHAAHVCGKMELEELVNRCVHENRSAYVEPNEEHYSLYQELIARTRHFTETLAAGGYL